MQEGFLLPAAILLTHPKIIPHFARIVNRKLNSNRWRRGNFSYRLSSLRPMREMM